MPSPDPIDFSPRALSRRDAKASADQNTQSPNLESPNGLRFQALCQSQQTTQLAAREWPESACAVKRRRFPVGARPTRRFAPAGSNRSSHGGNEMAEAFE